MERLPITVLLVECHGCWNRTSRAPSIGTFFFCDGSRRERSGLKRRDLGIQYKMTNLLVFHFIVKAWMLDFNIYVSNRQNAEWMKTEDVLPIKFSFQVGKVDEVKI